MADPDFGVDLAFTSDGDLAPTFALVSGPMALAASMARRFSTKRGPLFWAPNAGKDLRELLNDSLSPADLARHRSECQAQAEQDERVLAASVDLSFNSATQTLTGTIRMQTAAGPFTLVLGVDRVTVSILSFE